VLITAEDLAIPDDILVRVVSKGSLFSIGLSPVATYADPGFTGNLGIVTENISDKYVELPQGEAIAKAGAHPILTGQSA
jgi:dCTP deaminase